MTTNEQAEWSVYDLAWQILTGRDDPWGGCSMRAEVERVAEWLAGERHRVAESVIAVVQHDRDGYVFGTPQWHVVDVTLQALRRAFPAVGGSTPAVDGEPSSSGPSNLNAGGSGSSSVDGEEGAKGRWPCRAECPGGHSHPLTTCESEPLPAVPDSLPLDPFPYVDRETGLRWRFAGASGYPFDPQPGFSRDESRYREGAGT